MSARNTATILLKRYILTHFILTGYEKKKRFSETEKFRKFLEHVGSRGRKTEEYVSENMEDGSKWIPKDRKNETKPA